MFQPAVVIHREGIARQEPKAGAEAQAMEEPGLLTFFFLTACYVTQEHLPKVGTPLSELGPPTLLINKMHHRLI